MQSINKEVEISFDDEPKSMFSGVDVERIIWKSGLVTEHPHSGVDCISCQTKVFGADIDRLKGHCNECYPRIVLGVPPRIDAAFGYTYFWERPVTQTRSGNPYPWRDYYPALGGNDNFGVGDTVLYDPRTEHPRSRRKPAEGEVLEIHQYLKGQDPRWLNRHGERTFGARVDFGTGVKFLPSQNLVVITNDHVIIGEMQPIPKMDEVPFKDFNQAGREIKKVFADPVARAIWMAYRGIHIASEDHIRILNTTALKISADLRETPLPGNRVGPWFRRNMRPGVDEKFAAFMVPYLTGEKVATFVAE